MLVPSPLKSIRLALLAGAIGAVFAVSPAAAQDAGRTDDGSTSNATTEQVIVVAPQFRSEPDLLNLPAKLSLSQNVSYSDLDLSTRDGARELRARVDETARDVCRQLKDAYPLKQQPLEHCYANAYRAAIERADEAIHDARDSGYHRARYGDEH